VKPAQFEENVPADSREALGGELNTMAKRLGVHEGLA
jgi:hypothetical protein